MSLATTALRAALSGRARWVPAPLVHGAGLVAADVTWWLRPAGVVQLEDTLARVVPGVARSRRRALSRAGMRSYLRYWCGLVTVPRLTPEQLRASVEVHGLAPLAEELAAGRGVVVALGHLGSWDHLGTWAAATLAPVTTVAERAGGPGLFEAFAAARSRAGITALPLDDPATSGGLRRALRSGHLVALLADRDLTGSGLAVDLLGSRVAFAPGPATLAVTTGARLFFAGCTYRRRARSRWAVAPWRRWQLDVRVTEVPAALPVPAPTAPPASPVPGVQRRAQRLRAVAEATQGCADALGASVRQSPQDWHVLQPVLLDEPPAPHQPDVAAGAGR